MEQIMEFLKANKAESEAERKADREMMARMEARMDSNQHEIKVQIGGLASRMDVDKEEMMSRMDNNKEEMIKAITGASQESTEACEEQTKALPETTEACPEVTHACLEEEKESTPKETDAMEEPQVVPEGATDEEKFGATEDRAGELRLVLRHRRERKKWAQVNGGPRQKFAAFRGRFIRRAVPALLKGHVRKGPRRNCGSGIREPGKTFRSKIDGRSLKQQQIKGNVARGTPGGRTCEKGGGRTRNATVASGG
jgi:hypothetical protein